MHGIYHVALHGGVISQETAYFIADIFLCNVQVPVLPQ